MRGWQQIQPCWQGTCIGQTCSHLPQTLIKQLTHVLDADEANQEDEEHRSHDPVM